jgi:alcohol dehydrogenase class IV
MTAQDMQFEFATATRIIFRAGTIQQVGPIAKDMGSCAFVVTGRSSDRAEPLLHQLKAQGIKTVVFHTNGEPTVTSTAEAVEQARCAACDVVIALGGGSVIDTGKAVAALLTNTGDITQYLEVVGQGKPITQRPRPFIAVPTTAGTGAEVTRNAVLGVPEHQRKVSIRSALMLPTVAIVDPELTLSLPPALTAGTGLDALTQLIEPFVSTKANPLTDGLCREGLMRAARSLYRAYEHGQDVQARQDMSLASLFGGLALANAKLGAVHGLAGPLGGHIQGPHGALCGRLLPYVMAANVKALQQRDPQSAALHRFHELGLLLTGTPTARAQDAVTWTHRLCQNMKTPPLSAFGLEKKDIPLIAQQARSSSSIKGNPIALTTDELIDILEQAL